MAGENEQTFEEELEDILDLPSKDEEDEDENEDLTEDEETEDEIDDDDEEDRDAEDPSEDEELEDEEEPGSDDDDEDEVEDEEEDELTQYKNQNAALLERLEALEGKPKPKEESDEEEEETEETVSFLSEDDDIDTILGSRAELEKFAQKIFTQAVQAATGQVQKQVVPNVSAGVSQQVMAQITMTKAIDGFFDMNEDLKAVRRTMGAITDEVVAEHGDWEIGKVLQEAGKRTRKALKMPAPKPKTKRKKGKRSPAFANGQNSRRQEKDTRSNVQKDVDELLDF